MFNILTLSTFLQSTAFKIVLVVGLVLGVYFKGYFNGKESEKENLLKQQNEQLVKALELQKDQLTKNHEAALELERNKKTIEYVYVKQKEKIEDLKKTNSTLNKDVCKLTKEEADILNKVLEDE